MSFVKFNPNCFGKGFVGLYEKYVQNTAGFEKNDSIKEVTPWKPNFRRLNYFGMIECFVLFHKAALLQNKSLLMFPFIFVPP